MYFYAVNEMGEVGSIFCDDPVMWIPIDEANSDYRDFLEWLANNGEPPLLEP